MEEDNDNNQLFTSRDTNTIINPFKNNNVMIEHNNSKAKDFDQKQIAERNDNRKSLMNKNKEKQIRAHSKVIIDNYNNKKVMNNRSESLNEIRNRIVQLTKRKADIDIKYKELSGQLIALKQQKVKIESQLENQISKRESYEEIYRYNISLYSNKRANSHNKIRAMLSVSSDNICVSEEEISSMNIEQYKEMAITIIKELFNYNREILFYNLIDSAIIKCLSEMNSNIYTGSKRVELLVTKLSKGISDVYPMINQNVFIVLLKYFIKQQYINKEIEKDLKFLSKEYKEVKNSIKAKISELHKQLSQCDYELKEARRSEEDLDRNMAMVINDSIQNATIITKQRPKTQREMNAIGINNVEFSKETSKVNNNKAETQRNQFELVNKQISDNKDIIKGNIVEEIKCFIPNITDSDNFSLRRSASNYGSVLIKNELAFSIEKEKKSEPSIIPLLLPDTLSNDNMSTKLFSPIEHQDYFNTFRTNRINKNEMGPSNDKTERVNNKSFPRSSSAIFQLQSHLAPKSPLFPKLNATYCYYKRTNGLDPKYNPLTSSSISLDKLGYEKGSISFDKQQLLLNLYSTSDDNHTVLMHSIYLSKLRKVVVHKPFKDIICVYQLYHEMLRICKDNQVRIDQFVLQTEFKHIGLSDNDKVKAALYSLFSFTIVYNASDMFEIVFVGYNEFRMWLNGLGCLITMK